MRVSSPSPDAPGKPAEVSPRRPWLAALFSLLTPGLGHIYAGQARRGALLGFGVFLLSAGTLLLSMYMPFSVLRVGIFLFVVSAVIYVAADAWRIAAEARSAFQLHVYNRWYVYTGIVLIVAYVIQPVFKLGMNRTIAEAFHIPGESMTPTVLRGDYLLAAPRLSRVVERGSVVVVRREEGLRVLQRVVGVPGDTVEMRAKVLVINGQPQTEPYVRHIDLEGNPTTPDMLWQREFLASATARAEEYAPSRDHWGPLIIPLGHYFLLGDDRDNSYDSRYAGFVSEADLVGRAGWVYFSRDPESGQIRWDRSGLAIR